MKLKDFDFRIWDKYHKGCNNKDCKCQTKYVYGEEAKTRLSEFKEDCEIELFTGLYDKNGNKIYEGDILEYTRWCEQYMEDAEHSETIYEVVCFDINVGLYSKLLNGEFGWFFEHFMNDKNNTIEEMSIIGNIHENKELLNVRL
ncbi:YopX family protein [Campylobacter coli]|uniref:YopX family protein n=1 Tax=Campylobacter coli TaxID=195 RepID=UPI0014829890|nr:YopX family protein [Campylobacter coli]